MDPHLSNNSIQYNDEEAGEDGQTGLLDEDMPRNYTFEQQVDITFDFNFTSKK